MFHNIPYNIDDHKEREERQILLFSDILSLCSLHNWEKLPFSITKKDNIEINPFKYCSPNHVFFLVLPQQSSLLGLYGPELLHLLGLTGKYSPSCETNTENKLF